jgi:hypothetical protein
MKLDTQAQKTLDALFASGDGKYSAGGVVFGTIAIFETGRANGMKYRVIKETFMTDDLRVGYGKYDLQRLKNKDNAEPVPLAKAAKKAVKKAVKKSKPSKKELTEEEKLKRMIEASKNWEVVYCAETERALEESEKMFK